MKLKILLLFSFPIIGLSQPAKGNYEYIDHSNMAVYNIQLLDSNEFTKSSGLMLGHGASLEKGYFTQNHDTIVFHFVPYNRPKPYFKIISKDTLKFDKWNKIDPSKTTSLSMHLFEDEENPLWSYASLVDLITEKTVLATINTDQQGGFQFFSSDTIIDQIRVRSFGYDELKISMEDFRGFRSKINVYLTQESPNDYRETEGEAKYLISEDAKYLQFIDADGSLGIKYTRLHRKE